MNQTHYYSLNQFLRERHGSKVIKLSIDGGFTCPNRDGHLSTGGCIFCSTSGSGDFAAPAVGSIHQQLASSIAHLHTKWPDVTKYIAYFQAYSNTYAPLPILTQKYEEALKFPGVVGLALATRPDCLPSDVIDYLATLKDRTHLWVELGLQTIHEATSHWLNRGHTLDVFDDAVYRLHEQGIEVVSHMILGLPGESKEAMLATAHHLAQLPLQGVKIHMLHILDDTPLAQYYEEEPFPLLSEEDYVHLVAEILKILPKHFVIHRLTGDGNRNHLIAPKWTLNKRHVLNHMHHYLHTNQIFQGTR